MDIHEDIIKQKGIMKGMGESEGHGESDRETKRAEGEDNEKDLGELS